LLIRQYLPADILVGAKTGTAEKVSPPFFYFTVSAGGRGMVEDDIGSKI
jgi:hypothetical protein